MNQMSPEQQNEYDEQARKIIMSLATAGDGVGLPTVFHGITTYLQKQVAGMVAEINGDLDKCVQLETMIAVMCAELTTHVYTAAAKGTVGMSNPSTQLTKGDRVCVVLGDGVGSEGRVGKVAYVFEDSRIKIELEDGKEEVHHRSDLVRIGACKEKGVFTEGDEVMILTNGAWYAGEVFTVSDDSVMVILGDGESLDVAIENVKHK